MRKHSQILLLLSYISGNIVSQVSCRMRHSDKSPYRIVIDGGSTGSRLHIFEFQKDLTSNTTACIRQGSDRAHIPLSAFARTDTQIETNEALNATHVAHHLIPLFQYAANIIPIQYHALTSVHYQATAGMRLLEEYEQTLVYDALFAGFKESPDFVFYNLQRENIATLGGEEEALYGAVAANYLSGVVDVKLHMINKDGTVEDEDIEFDGPLGALDMGGASMQIVYLPHEEFEEDCDNYDHVHGDESESESLVQHRTKTSKGLKELPNLPNRPNRLNGDEFFSTSYLSYGADQFRERLWDNWVEKRELNTNNVVFDTNIIDNPCSFNGYTSEWKGYTFVGTGDAKRCAKEVNRLIPHHKEPTDEFSEFRTVGGVTHPPIRGHFFAMSLFFFTLDCLRELSNHQGLNDTWPTPSISDLTQALDILCSRDWNDDLAQIQDNAHKFTRSAVLPDRCFESVYMVTLLRDGFGFDLESRDITFTFLVDGSEVEWSLGMAVSHFAEDHVHAYSIMNRDTNEEEELMASHNSMNPCPSPSCTTCMLNNTPMFS